MTMKVFFEKETYRLLDTRTPEEYAVGHMEGFRNILLDELRDRLDEIGSGKLAYVVCQSGLRSYIACRILEANGHAAYNFAGGFRLYDAVTNDRCLIETAAPAVWIGKKV